MLNILARKTEETPATVIEPVLQNSTGQTEAMDTGFFKNMLDCIPINVMVCDPKTLIVTYANQTSLKTLKELEHLLPIKADDLVGTCIDIFHKNPARQRELLADPDNLPYSTTIELGEESLDLVVHPIFDGAGNYVAPALTWSVVTEKIRVERETERLTQMVDKMPINVMMCDPDSLEITYLNESSKKTLKSLEQYLPVSADNLLGQCIDVFHKNPEHQRRILSDPGNLPHSALIDVGPEKLDLRVAPIMAADGSYMGPILTWSVVTKQYEVEQAVQEAAENLSAESAKLKTDSETMSQVAEQTRTQSQTVSAASEQTANNVQTVAAAAEELSVSIAEITEQVALSAKIAQEAVEESERTDEAIQGLAEASEKIGAVVDLINDIAGQTNLLALNATIEAARAGDAGKGFAVVASEVKNLAGQTETATGDIAKQVGSIQDGAQKAVEAIATIKATISKTSEIASAIAAAVEEQGAATGEISRNINQTVSGTQEISTSISQILESAGQSGKAAEQVSSSADGLAELAITLKGEVAKLLIK